jgi:two-component system sensor histidine kinase BaeS
MEGGWNPATAAAEADLREIVANVTGRAAILARARGIAFEAALPDGPVLVRCDRFAAEQAISNLVENAVAYGDVGGHVAVVLDATRQGFTLSVIDDGPGVSTLELPLLGTRTFRADSARQRDPRGSGLGVAISHEVCRRSGWSLRFAHEQPRGLRATIEGSAVAAR